MIKPIRVIIVINELLRGGAQRIVSDLAAGIHKSEFSVTVVYLKSHKNFGEARATLEEEIRRAGVRVESMEGAQRFSFSEFMRLVRYLRKEKPDIVHTYLPYAGIVGRSAARLAGVRRVISTQCNTRVAYLFWGFWFDRLTLVLASCWTAAAPGIELTYASSVLPFSRDAWKKGRRHFTIVAGVDLPVFDTRVAATDKDTKRKEIGIPAHAPLVMMVARLIPWKGPADLVAAMQHVPGAHLALVGWGPMEEGLKRQAADAGTSDRVHILGARNDVAELLKTADVYVQAHNRSANGDIWMGPNTSQMEACAAGIPSVSTSVPLIEALIEDGKTGVLARPNDPKDLARAIQYLLDHPDDAKHFARAARTRVEERFSVAAMVRSYESLYEAVLGR